MERKRDLETELFRLGLMFLGAGSGLWVLYHFALQDSLPRFPCLLDAIFRIYCPGCGGTRAVLALARGDLLRALWYHPLIPYAAAVGGGFMATQGLERLGAPVRGWRYHGWYLYGAIAVTVLNFIGKNLLRLVWGIGM